VTASTSEGTVEQPLDQQPLGRRATWRRRRRARTAILVGMAVVVLGAVALAARGVGGDGGQRPASSTLPPATATVTRMTLTQTERVAGTLGYGPTGVVIARAGTATSPPAAAPTEVTPSPSPSLTVPPTTNTITWLPAPGAIIKRGEPVYRVDNRPVILLVGDTPPYHHLANGVRGPDVRLLETNLRALGYTGFTVDDSYTSATGSVVKRWQRSLGLPQTGTVDVNQVVVAPGPIRVAELKTGRGADATGEVLSYTATTRVVTVPLEVTRLHLVSGGLAATVNLPNGKTVTGIVASIGSVASQPGDGAPGNGTPTVDVVITIADQAALGTLDAAPVDLVVVVAEKADVLTVPVGALLALTEGGYGVQLVEGSTTRYVAVTTGMFAGGRVEVSGPEIAEGVTVGVPA
jgi:peptidoglycan hydrolase-like protein with peptidoglycan-binding domain